MRCLALVLAILTWCAASGSAQVGTLNDGGPGDVVQSGFTFPPSIRDLRRISVRDYEAQSPGLGFSVGYQSARMTGTVYVYDLQIAGIPDGTGSPDVRAAFQGPMPT